MIAKPGDPTRRWSTKCPGARSGNPKLFPADELGEFETSDAEIRRLGPGGVLFAEDIWGNGHISRHPEQHDQQVILIRLPDGIQPAAPRDPEQRREAINKLSNE